LRPRHGPGGAGRERPQGSRHDRPGRPAGDGRGRGHRPRAGRPSGALQGRARPVKSYDLIGCGALNLDLIYRLPADSPLWRELPPPGAEQAITPELRAHVDAALADIEPTRSGGGQAANTSFALARLGFSSAMLGRIGADDDGRFLAAELAPCDARYLALDGESGRVYVLLNEAGARRNRLWAAAND